MTGNRSATPAETATAAAAAAGTCLHHQFEAQAKRRPDARAVSCGSTSLTYGELDRRANQLANQLVAAGVAPDATVGLCLDRSVELLIGLLGILKAGGAYVPLDPAYPPDRLAHIIDQAAPDFIVTCDELSRSLPASGAQTLDISEIDGADTASPSVSVGPDHLCYLIFTSGSTGLPKGVMVTHHNVVRLFSTIGQQMEFRDDDVWTLFHSYAFGFSAWEIFGSLLHGAHLIIVPDDMRGDPAALYGLLRAEKVTVFSQTPSAFRQLLLHEAFDNSDSELSLRSIVFSGEAVVTRDLEAWFNQHGKSGPELINTYAITETGGQVAIRRYEQQPH